MKDEMFIRGNAPMTKEEVRAVSISKMNLKKDSTVLDVGAGTGSISIEIALKYKESMIYSIEKKEDRIKLMNKNIKKFNVKNIVPITGMAPNDLPNDILFDAIIVGGSSGNMEEILKYSYKSLKPNGVVIINTITIENLYKGLDYIKKSDFINSEVTQMSIAKSKSISNLTLMMGQNPIFIIKAEKRGE